MRIAGSFHGIVRTFGHRDYRIYISGAAISLIGNWMQRLGIGWLTWELTHSAAWLGIVAFAELFPSVIIGPFGGVLADRLSRTRIIIIAQSVLTVQAFALFALTAMDVIAISSLVALSVVQGVAVGFNQPARLALVPNLVPHEDLAVAVAINSITFNTARFIGPAVAGALIVVSDVSSVFACNVLSFLAFLAAMSMIRVDGKEADVRHGTMLADIRSGLRYIVDHPGIRPLMLLMIGMSLGARPFVELMPGLAADVFGRGAAGLAMLSSMVGIGAIIGGFMLARRQGTDGLARTALLSALGVAASILLLVATTSLVVGLIAVAMAGITMVTTGVAAQTLVQTTVDGRVRGRVMSLWGLIFRGGPAIGALFIGAAADVIGLRPAIAAGAALTIVVWAVVWRQRDALAPALEMQRASSGAPPG